VGHRIVSYARQYIGWPYQWGGGNEHGPTRGSPAHGTSHLGWDCSGLTKYAVYQATNGRVNLTHLAADQYHDHRLRHVGYDQLQPGDLVFFHPDLSHVGIYTGNGQMIHAPRTGRNVEPVAITTGYYHDNFVGAARVTP
jgi:cell wall-associated NlpC family hydrolase